MNKQVLSEINRFREIIGLSLINESPLGPGPAQKGIEEVLEKLGIQSERIEKTSIEEIERALSKDVSTLDKFEKIGAEVESGSLKNAERLIDDLISNPAEWKVFVSLIKSNPVVFSEISDNMVKELTGSQYQSFIDMYEKIESKIPGKGSEAVERAANNLGYTNNINRDFWKGWKPKIITNQISTSVSGKSIKAINKIVEKLGVTGEKGFNEQQFRQLETILKRNSPKFMNDLESIVQKLEKGDSEGVEKLINDLISNKDYFETTLTLIKSLDKDTYSKIIDGQINQRFGTVNYEKFIEIYKNFPQNQRKWALQQTFKSLGLTFDEDTERLFKDWIPNKMENKLPVKSVEKTIKPILSTIGGGLSEKIEKPKLALGGSGLQTQGISGYGTIYNDFLGKNVPEGLISDNRTIFGSYATGYRVNPKLDKLGNQQVDFVVGNTGTYENILDANTRPNVMSLTLVLEPGQKLSEDALQKIQNKFYDEVKQTISYLPIEMAGRDVTKLPKAKWEQIMKNMENFIEGK